MARQVDRRHGRAEPPAAPRPAQAPAADPRAASNQALAAVLARKVGWERSGAANAGERESSGLRRLPIEGIAGGDFPRRAIVILPAATAGSANVDVLLHLHGFTPGYAGAKPDDEGVYRIEAQLAASKRELIGILPQGDAAADFNAGAGKAFDADDFIRAVFARLTAEGAWDTEQGPAPGTVILSGHSGADQPIAEMLDSGQGASGKAPGKLAGLFLFDSMIASAFSGSVWHYVDRRLKDELDSPAADEVLPRPKDEVEAGMETWLRENGFRLHGRLPQGRRLRRGGERHRGQAAASSARRARCSGRACCR